jgi:hypothetical protein
VRISEQAKRDAAVASSGEGEDPDGGRLPAGEVHGWWRGQDETTCGVQLARAELVRFPALRWGDVQPASGGSADLVRRVCRRCAAALLLSPGRTPRRLR